MLQRHCLAFKRSTKHLLSIQSRIKMTESVPIATNGNIPDGYEVIVEGQASMLYEKKEAVFYNKVQVLNRDTSIQTIRLFAEQRIKEKNEKMAKNHPDHPKCEGIRVLDALAATGLRSIRYLKEIPGVSHVTINDLLPEATTQALENCKRNNVDESRVTINTGDAIMYMYNHREHEEQYDVIDLDPYGSASPFIDSAVQAVADGGLLCVTCTDMPVLSGNYPETCFAKYGTVSIKAGYHAEHALRTLLQTIDTAANKYARYIVPYVSLAIDFYCRVFVRVFKSPAEVKKSCTKRAMVLQSTQCPTYYLQPLATESTQSKKRNKAKAKAKAKAEASGESSTPPPPNTNIQYTNAHMTVPTVCEETGGRLKIAGPFWSAPLHDMVIVNELLRRLEANEGLLPFPVPTKPRLTGLLTAVSEELNDVPFYTSLSDLCSTMNCKGMPMIEMKAALINAGYRVSNFHKDPIAIKTDAPNGVLWDIMRAFVKKSTDDGVSKKKKLQASSVIILEKKNNTDIEVDFTIPECLLGEKKKALRFPPNPEANWGPKRRAGRPPVAEEESKQASDKGSSPVSKKMKKDDI
jgi:tRNA (guanine26-N2/guanine27-N2)-dimethyltransferase